MIKKLGILRSHPSEVLCAATSSSTRYMYCYNVTLMCKSGPHLSSMSSDSTLLKWEGNLRPGSSGEDKGSCAGAAMSRSDSRRVTDSDILSRRCRRAWHALVTYFIKTK